MLRGRVGERDQVGLGLVERGGDVGETAGGGGCRRPKWLLGMTSFGFVRSLVSRCA